MGSQIDPPVRTVCPGFILLSHNKLTAGSIPVEKIKQKQTLGVDNHTYTALMPTTVQSNDQRINRAHHGVPLISHGGENLILKEIQRGIRTKISSADYYYYILILHNTILWRLIFLLTTKRTKNRTNS